MVIMTEGLHRLAGNKMRAALMRFTRSPYSGAATGAITTAILQSSSATTVAAVGFVGAGLMSFSAALGIIFGANLGTTITGWLVALFGFKIKLGTLAFPLLFGGVLLRLFGRERLGAIGYSLAGFALIFIGIATLQQGMQGLQGLITPDTLPADTALGRIELLGLGIVFTLITQSSSAGVATALTALNAGAISFEQAAALVVGMDVGTTATAALATLGGTVGARRTGFSHVIYNLMTGAAALLLITPYTALWDALAPGLLLQEAEIGLVAFHSSFNLIGVIAVLPFTRQFARLIIRLVPDRGPLFTHRLDTALLDDTSQALNAAQDAIHTEIITLLHHTQAILGDEEQGRRTDLALLQGALDETHSYVDQIHLPAEGSPEWERLLHFIHTLDHLQRLHERCEEDEDRAFTARESGTLQRPRQLMIEALRAILTDIDRQDWLQAAKQADAAATQIQQQVSDYREQVVEAIARGEIDVPDGTDQLEAIRWMNRVSTHVARICDHFGSAILAAGK